MRIEQEIKLDFKDVLIKPKRSKLNSRADVILTRSFIMPNAINEKGENVSINCVPIFAANMDTTGTFEMAIELSKHKVLTAIHKYYSVNDWKMFNREINNNNNIIEYIAISMGATVNELEKTKEIMNEISNINIIVIDVANGYTEVFVNIVKQVRATFPSKIIIAGNVVTSEMTEELILSGVDIVKIGIGPGSVCTTRLVTGVGYPQLSSIIECADAAHGLGGLVMSDGGCAISGDIAKAFGAGADFVMLGGMFSGHEECNGKLIEENGKKYKEFYGMSSEIAMEKYSGGVADYRSAEGKRVLVEYRGSVRETILQILGGIRSTCTYVGAKKLKELSKRTTFIRVTQQVNNIFSK